ncbi:hypothetical protein FH972_012375 [Carpinus fangiana]|uniref:Uncharacterized protein n=1 Tax=Carpinus fangiana TaxID=176857 RepID=A0A5N6R3M8_9ROSI|nr:hypothetical protein FH972_012375 [Carpinus fangiana]
MRGPFAHELVLLLLGLLICSAATVGFALNLDNYSKARCPEKERQALLKFKQGLIDNHGMLSSWRSHEEDCCKWKGVKCSNRTGHVVKLDLQGRDFHVDFPDIPVPLDIPVIRADIPSRALSGEISSSILGLQYLTYLDLSFNNFSIIPEFIGSLTNLQYLNLSNTFISTTIPPQLGNLSSLISLDLSGNNYLKIKDHNLDWLFHLSSLRYLNMSGVNLRKAVNWLDKVALLPSLLDLRLSDCKLSMPFSPVLVNASSSSPLSLLDLSSNHLNSSIFPRLFKYSNSLTVLDLHDNELEGSIPKALGNMATLVHLDLSSNNLEGLSQRSREYGSSCSHLDLSSNKLEGTIPQTLENLHNLQVLDLSGNHLNGSLAKGLGNMVALVCLDLSSNKLEGAIPQTLENLQNLQVLALSGNHLNGSLTKGVGKLSKLQVLDVSSNFLEGDITEEHLSNLFSLKELDLSFNSVSLKLSPNWVPPFHLNTIKLSSCKLGPAFPQWLQTQNNFSWLDMSDVGISNAIPNWFWDLSSNIKFLNLAHNQITGTIPRSWFLTRSTGILKMDLSYNRFNGPLPQFHYDSTVLNLSNNLFEGSITSICETSESGFMYANFMVWSYLDLSNNSLSGELPNCWGQMSLIVLNLGNNNFSGRIPDDICGSKLATLQLHNNNFIGELPKSMIACSSLRVLDLGENRLSGRIPAWMGTSLPKLAALLLPSNLFMGRIPLQLCHLTSLQILDFSHNRITGTIPQCLNNFTFMAKAQGSNGVIYAFSSGSSNMSFATVYIDKLFVTWKEKYVEYTAQNPQTGSKHGEGNIAKHTNSHDHLWFYTSIALGFIVGFWGVCGSLLLKSSWRHAYFRYLERIGDWLYVTIAVRKAKLLRNFKTQR